jgi:TPR repeat protein
MEKISERKWQSLTRAAESGDAEAQWELGYYCEQGAVTRSGKTLSPKDRSAAMSWYLRAAEQDHAAAKVSLSNLLSEGDNPDFQTAISWAKSAVAQGDASAAYNLGIIYRDLGKPKAAFRYYQLAATMGDAEAHLQVGLCFLLGHGTAIDHAAAQVSFQKVLQVPAESVSQRSREDALYWLALLNLMGLGQRRSVGRAREMLAEANADDDHEQANDILNVIGKFSRPRIR